MRYQGTLIEWNAARGFGFVRRHGDGDGKVFVHVSTFGHRGVQPEVGDVITYAIELDAHGRPRATDVTFARSPAKQPPGRRPVRSHASRGAMPRIVVSAALLAALGAFAWARYQAHEPDPDTPAAAVVPATMAEPSSTPASAAFRCSGKRHCGQMTSCAEATFHLRHCPGTIADGDGDGIPCEDQLCGH